MVSVISNVSSTGMSLEYFSFHLFFRKQVLIVRPESQNVEAVGGQISRTLSQSSSTLGSDHPGLQARMVQRLLRQG
jgi:hypothetical protein